MLNAEQQAALVVERTAYFFERVSNAVDALETAKSSLLSRVVEAMVAEVAANDQATAKSASKLLASRFPTLSEGTEAVYRSWARKALEKVGESNIRKDIPVATLDAEAFQTAVIAFAEGLKVRPDKAKASADKANDNQPEPAVETTPQLELHTQAAEAMRQLQLMVEAGDETAVAHVQGLAGAWDNLQRAMAGHAARLEMKAAEEKAAKRKAQREARKLAKAA